jgi:hypothetical protein
VPAAISRTVFVVEVTPAVVFPPVNVIVSTAIAPYVTVADAVAADTAESTNVKVSDTPTVPASTSE